MAHPAFFLTADCPATVIPDGFEITLPRGTAVTVTQALGGSLTVRSDKGLFRIEPEHVGTLGPEAAARFRAVPAEAPDPAVPLTEGRVWEALRQCFDPEIPVNIVDLGLIYDLRLDPTGDGRQRVAVRMTLTAPGCGMGPSIAHDAKSRIEALPGVESAEVRIVWDPQWTPQMISPDGRKMLGIE